MAATPQDCVNYEINIQMCPCASETCAHRGICCECIKASIAAGAATECMKPGVERNPATVDLMAQAVQSCSLNHQRNLEFCVCGSDTCTRKGICCNCVRNHFTVDGTGRVACMR